MHFAIPMVVTAFLITPVQAQTTPAAPSAQKPAPAVAASVATPPAAPSPTAAAPAQAARPAYRRQTLLQRFDDANTPKDGHLTQDQASAARWTYVTRNFDAMDKAHKGFITVDDIRAFARERRAARQGTQPAPASHG
jgi:hypothetical protein